MRVGTMFLDEIASLLVPRIKACSEWFSITTQLVDRHNDLIEIWVKDDGAGKFEMHDDGAALEGAREARPETLRALQALGVAIDETGRLCTTAREENFAPRVYALAQAISMASYLEGDSHHAH